MADAIYGILNYPSMSEYLKKAGKKEVKEFKWEKTAKNVMRIYESLIA